jgi:MinD-like ATPase involved in chromosome partitioning or flagellar assembly
MQKKYIYVTGGKGGIGKSTMAQAIADYMATSGQVLLVDTDPTNADSSASYKDGKDANVRAIRAKIRSEDSSGQIDSSGLIDTLNLAETDPATAIIIDAPAGDSTLLVNAGEIITAACKQAGIKSVFVWLVDSNDRTPVNALHAAWDAIKDADQVLIVKNYRKGDNFEFFDNAKSMATVNMASNVRTIAFPKIASRIEEHLRIERLNWKEIATVTPLGNRVEGARLRSAMHATLKSAGL